MTLEKKIKGFKIYNDGAHVASVLPCDYSINDVYEAFDAVRTSAPKSAWLHAENGSTCICGAEGKV